MRQFTRFYLDKNNRICHVHTNSLPFDFEPVIDDNAPYKIDMEIDISDDLFIKADEIFKKAFMDKNKEIAFSGNKRLQQALKKTLRSDSKASKHDKSG